MNVWRKKKTGSHTMWKFSDLEKQLLSYKAATCCFPFDEHSPVFKVRNKIFAIVSLDQACVQISLKCDPDDALILRSQFKAVLPGYHLNKDHWNTVMLDDSLDPELVNKLIDDSYKLVIGTLSKKEQLALRENRPHISKG